MGPEKRVQKCPRFLHPSSRARVAPCFPPLFLGCDGLPSLFPPSPCFTYQPQYTNAAGTLISGSLDRSPAVFLYPNTPRLAVRVSGSSNPDWHCDPDLLLDSNRWYHIVLVIETTLLQVFLDGRIVCITTYNGDTLLPTPGREFTTGTYGGSSGLVDVSDIRWCVESPLVLVAPGVPPPGRVSGFLFCGLRVWMHVCGGCGG